MLISILPNQAKAQIFGSKSFYLVDSLDLSELTKSECHLIDSCLASYHSSNSDTGRLIALNFLVDNSWNEAVWPIYNSLMYELARSKFVEDPCGEFKDHYLVAGANAIDNFGHYAEVQLSDFDTAITLYHQSLDIWEEIGDSNNMVNSYDKLGRSYRELGDYKMALDYHTKALQYAERNDHEYATSNQLSNLAVVYSEQKEYDLALEFSKRALQLRRKIGDQDGEVTSLSNIAGYYNQKEELDSARYYYEEALRIVTRLRNHISMALIYDNLGSVNQKEGDYQKALAYFEKAVELSESLGDMRSVSRILNSLSSIYWYNGDNKQAKELSKKGLEVAQKVGCAVGTEINAGLLSQILAQERNYKDALSYRNLEIQIRDSIANLKAIKRAAQQQASYEYEKRAAEDRATIVRQNLEIKQRYYQLVVTIGGLLLLFMTVGVLCLRLRINKIKHELAEKKTQADLSLLISDNKVRHDFDQQLMSRLEALRELDSNELKHHINRCILDLKNQLNFAEKQQCLSEGIHTLHYAFEKQLKEQFPQLTTSEIEICHLFKLNKSIKEIASLKNTSEGAIRTSRYRIKSKLGLGKEVSLDDYIKAEI